MCLPSRLLKIGSDVSIGDQRLQLNPPLFTRSSGGGSTSGRGGAGLPPAPFTVASLPREAGGEGGCRGEAGGGGGGVGGY